MKNNPASPRTSRFASHFAEATRDKNATRDTLKGHSPPSQKASEGHGTSWQRVGKWYSELTHGKGHYYHEHVVIPGVRRLLALSSHDSVIDLACGSGVLGRATPRNVDYLGIDIARSLIDEAKRRDTSDHHDYLLGDITRPIPELLKRTKRQHAAIGDGSSFTKAACVLALQNVENYQDVFQNAAELLTEEGTFVIVLNHPCFRIPRQSAWGIDPESKLQYRRVNRYLSPLKIPITAHPGNRHSPVTWSFHNPLSEYISGLARAGFVITGMEEWSSDKESEGNKKKMEDRARNEIPLFLTIVAEKR